MTAFKQNIQEIVALEFGFESQLIHEVLSHQTFACAGDLIDYLSDLTDAADDENLERVRRKQLEKETEKEEEAEKQHLEEEDSCLETLRRETAVLYLRSKCLECRKNSRNIVTMPCSHLTLCETCSEKTTQCPSCKETIVAVVKTFWS